MNTISSLVRKHRSLNHKWAPMWVPQRLKTSIPVGGYRLRKKKYHRVHELDSAMDLRKKPAMIIELTNIIQSQKTKCLFLRDLETEFGFVRKWDFMALIGKHPKIFQVGGGDHKSPPFVRLTEKAELLGNQETEVAELMEPILAKNLRKLLMLTVDCRVPIEKIKNIGPELGLPFGFEDSLISKYPEFFSIREENGIDFVQLESWDSSFAVTYREERLAKEGIFAHKGNPKRVTVSKTGNYPGPHSFLMKFHARFRPNTNFLEELEKWQKMDFPSPYLNARRRVHDHLKTMKRAVAVIHEILSLTMEKRLSLAQLDTFHSECYLPSKLLSLLVKHHGMFYLTNIGERSTVLLKEAYDGSQLVEKCPILMFNAKLVGLSGRVGVETSAPKNVLR